MSESGDSTYMIKNAEIIIIKGKDTLTKIKTDKKGFYQWKSDVIEGGEFLICAQHEYYANVKTQFKVTTYNSLIIFNFMLTAYMIDRPNFPIYELNEMETFSNFDIELLKQQIRKHKNLCVKFSQWQNPEESKKVGIKRMKKFKKLLKKNGVSIKNFKFELNPIVMNCAEQTDCRSKIQGVVISLGEKCN